MFRCKECGEPKEASENFNDKDVCTECVEDARNDLESNLEEMVKTSDESYYQSCWSRVLSAKLLLEGVGVQEYIDLNDFRSAIRGE